MFLEIEGLECSFLVRYQYLYSELCVISIHIYYWMPHKLINILDVLCMYVQNARTCLSLQIHQAWNGQLKTPKDSSYLRLACFSKPAKTCTISQSQNTR